MRHLLQERVEEEHDAAEALQAVLQGPPWSTHGHMLGLNIATMRGRKIQAEVRAWKREGEEAAAARIQAMGSGSQVPHPRGG